MSMIDDSQLIDLLAKSDAISKKDLRKGVALAQKRGKALYETLVEHELIDERALVKGIGKFLNVRPVWLGDRTPDEEVTDRVPRSLALRNKVLPLKVESGSDSDRLVLAMYDPLDVLAMDEVASHTGVDVRPVLAGPGDLARALERVYGAAPEEEDSAELDFLEQAASGEFDATDFEDELLDDVADDGLEDDSWATFFDQAEDVDMTEDSAVISRDMKDRAISSVLDAVDPQDDDEADGEDSLKSLDEPLSKSQITGGIQPDLADWEVDGALDGQDTATDYAKIGQLFVYSPEKAAAQSEATDEKKESKKPKEKKSQKAKEQESQKAEKQESQESESKPEPEDESDRTMAGVGIGDEPSKAAAIITPKKKLDKPKLDKQKLDKQKLDKKSAPNEVADEPSDADEEPVDRTSVSASPFGMGSDELSEVSEPLELEEVVELDDVVELEEEIELEDEDDEDEFEDTGSHTAFGFGPASLLAESEASEADDEPAAERKESEDGFSDVRSTQKNHAVVFEKAKKMNDVQDPSELFATRMAELADLDERHKELLANAAPSELIYATVLALAQSDVLDVRELLEYLGPV
ncbi:GspE/PulE/PilB domain-containing protein [Persicimonas caeni]|nr:hypothetical protein [Persicimonas caeni]